MSEPRFTLFISDLHLQESEPEVTRQFLDFLEQQAPKADALYILGDFFDVWVGDDEQNDYQIRIINALRQFTDSGIPTYFMHGNRDFFTGKRFFRETGMVFVKDPTVIDLYNNRILLMHGDSLCSFDKKHMLFRKIMRNTFTKRLLLSLTLKQRKKIGCYLRQKSQYNNAKKSQMIMDVNPVAVQSEMLKHKTQQLIHGHTHRPNIHDITIDNNQSKRIVLGAWHHKPSFLMYFENGEYQLMR